MEVRGDLNVRGTLLQDGTPVDEGTSVSEFYLTVKQTNGLQSFSGISVINFGDDFYVSQNSPNTDEVVVDFRGTAGGEVNTASNKTGDEGIFFQKTGVDLEFKSLTAGSNITLTPTDNQITIAASGGAGVTFKESESGGASFTTSTLAFDSNPFYLSAGGDGNPIASMKDSPGGLLETVTVQIEVANIKTYILDQSADYPYRILKFVRQSNVGGAIGGFYINGVGIAGLDPISFYPQEETIIPTDNFLVNPGDKVILSIFDNESAQDISFNLRTQRD